MRGLFNDRSIRERFQENLKSLDDAARSIPPEVIQNANLDELSRDLAEQARVEAPLLLESEITQQQTETTVEVDPRSARAFDHGAGTKRPGMRLQVIVPFRGEGELLKCSPTSMIPLRSVEGKIAGNQIIFTHVYILSDAGGVAGLVNDWLKRLREKLQVISTEVSNHNNQLEHVARTLLDKRKAALGVSSNVSKALGFPLHRRTGTPAVYAVPLARKPLSPATVSASKGTLVREWIIQDSDYEEILSILSAMSLSMERMPQAFVQLTEEDIRAFFLAYLNAHYKGGATGETFNAKGKTDILVQVEGRTVFIAECKFWNGGEAFKEALNQLLTYLTWRDTKTALVIFNRRKNMSGVLKQIPDLVTAHAAYSGGEGQVEETRFRYLLRHPQDAERTLIVTVLVFNVPTN